MRRGAAPRWRIALNAATVALPSVILLAVLISVHVEAVNRSNFRTCEQTGFCKRQRSIGTRSPVHSIDADTVQFYRDHVTADVLGMQGERLALEINFYEDSTARIRLNDKVPMRARFQVPEVLSELHPRLYEVLAASRLGATLKYGTSSMVLQYAPLVVELYNGKEKTMTLNGRGLFNFEVQRDRGNDTSSSSDGLWEESFQTHQDSKPFGPMALMVDATFERAAHVYGLPLHATSLALKPTLGSEPYRMYNLDVFEYEIDNAMALYGSVPFMLAHGRDATVGLLWLNAAEMFVDVEHEDGVLAKLFGGTRRIHTRWMAETGIIDLFLFSGPTPRDVLRQYTGVTGRAPLPQRFATGYHQCRWNYRDEADVAAVNREFNNHGIAYDVLWLDIEHTNGKRYFTWDATLFPDPVGMQRALARQGRKMVTIVDPHIKRDPGYQVHSDALARGLYIRDAKGEREYEGHCWPGPSSWLDFSSPVVRQYWADQFAYDRYQGSTPTLYTWNDMNEPSQFNGPEITMHKDARHANGVEHRELHNMYGYLMHMSTYTGLLQRNADQDDRPFVLTRSFFAGTQRWGAIWTGDNAAQWPHLAIAQPMLLSLGVAGLPFVGADVGGFFGNPDPELLVRWYQAAAFQPFFRGHAHIDTKRREPWLFGEPYTSLIRTAIRTRYALLPYWSTLWWHASATGLPLMRPLFFEFPTEERIFDTDDTFMLGPALLIKPVTTAGQHDTTVFLPGNAADTKWYEYGALHVAHAGGSSVTVPTPLAHVPVFLRGGSVLARRDRPRRSAAAMEGDPFTLLVALDGHGHARGDLYLDDGHSMAYLRGDSVHREFVFANRELRNGPYVTSLQAAAPSRPLTAPVHASRVATPAVHRYGGEVERVVVTGLPGPVSRVRLVRAGHSSDVAFELAQGVLTVRQPGVHIHQDWALRLD